jgi:hypothetical protein
MLSNLRGDLGVVYQLGYFYVMCYECGDIDGYRCRHRNARKLLGVLV